MRCVRNRVRAMTIYQAISKTTYPRFVIAAGVLARLVAIAILLAAMAHTEDRANKRTHDGRRSITISQPTHGLIVNPILGASNGTANLSTSTKLH